MYQLEFYPFSAFPFRGLTLLDCGRQRCSGPYETKPGIRGLYSLHLIFSGKGYFRTRGQEWALTAGDGFLIRPNEIISYQADAENPWEYGFVSFDGTDAPLLIREAGLEEKCVFHPADPQEAQDALLRLLNICQGKGRSLAQYSALMEMAAHIPLQSPPPPSRVGAEYFGAAVLYIHKSYAYPISVVEMAAHIGIDRTYLYRLFKRFANLSPQAYLRDYRIRKAKKLLAETDLTLEQVASSTGMSSAAHLSKAFRDTYGYAPGTLRHSLQKGEAEDPQKKQK